MNENRELTDEDRERINARRAENGNPPLGPDEVPTEDDLAVLDAEGADGQGGDQPPAPSA